MVYYRKYRPQTIGDLDSAKVREMLTAVLSVGRTLVGNKASEESPPVSRQQSDAIPHAFLFTGSKGLGKTSTARIVAKAVNCERLHTGIDPCDQCESCLSITNGTHIDVLEIDGASNRGIDEIRSLREKVHLAPSHAKVKVYIIDEVHMLTTEAFNALLKTIEEPPAHSMFIFCTTEPHKVPDTIFSRCFHIIFQTASEEEILRSLKRIVEGEKIKDKIEDAALKSIAEIANGGFRDAAKILEELVALSGEEKITKEMIEAQYHTAHISTHIVNLYRNLSERKVKEALAIIQEVANQGTDFTYFIRQLLTYGHTILLSLVGISTDNQSRQGADRFSLEDVQTLAALFSEAYQQMKYSPIPQLPLELAIVVYCQQVRRANDEQDGDGVPPSFVNTTRTTIDSLLKKQHIMKAQSAISLSASGHGEKDKEQRVKTKEPDAIVQKDLHTHNSDERVTLMENLIYKVKPYNHSIAGVLRGCSMQSVSDSRVIFSTSYRFHKERLEEKKAREIVEKALKELTGKQLNIMIELKK